MLCDLAVCLTYCRHVPGKELFVAKILVSLFHHKLADQIPLAPLL